MERGWLKPSEGKAAKSKDRSMIKVEERTFDKDIIQHLKSLHNHNLVQPIKVIRQKTLLEKLLQVSNCDRNKKVLRKIKAMLRDLRCFKLEDKDQYSLLLTKHDINLLLSLLAPFVYLNLCPKGTLIDAFGQERSTIRILLRGKVLVFEPINQKSRKYSLEKAAKDQQNLHWLRQICVIPKDDFIHYDIIVSGKGQRQQKLITALSPKSEDFVLELIEAIQQKQQSISSDLALKLLSKCNIHSALSPQDLTVILQNQGDIISAKESQQFMRQSNICQFSAICASECFVMQLQRQIYDAIVKFMGKDHDKIYIKTLMACFPMLDYHEAKVYVTSDCIMDSQQTNKSLDHSGDRANLEQPNVGEELQQKKEEQLEELKQYGAEAYQLPFTGQVYLIAEGEAILRINRTKEIRFSELELAQGNKHYKSQDLLRLYRNDLFGFEQIGKDTCLNLRYAIKKGSKILKINHQIFKQQISEKIEFKNSFDNIQLKRNRILKDVVNHLRKSLQQKMLNKYKNIANLVPKSTNEQHGSLNLIKSVQYIGDSKFNKLSQELLSKLAGEKLAPDKTIFKYLIHSQSELNKYLSLSSQYDRKQVRHCRIVGQYLEMRDSKSNLLRRRSIVPKNGQQQTEIFKKLGILSPEERNVYNTKVVNSKNSEQLLPRVIAASKSQSRLKGRAMSLPLLRKFYSKKTDLQFRGQA